MSEVKLISPLLDGFSMGNPISEHNGVRCCPAIKENTDKKYIVKIISIPATQAQMDALLLAGAYKDPADAMQYFLQISEDILKEAELLKTLSKLDGFLPYEGWQMEPITRRRLGYEVYLVGSYKRSLEKYLKSHPVTHLEAINLGLDMCAALTVCRDAGALYVALKPANIFVSEKKEYRIGDLGFLQLDALNYSALPEKYHSPYTPPELLDPMAPMNLTVDTYALGMILYQLYNDGQLPFKGMRSTDEELATPLNADYEMAEIIMKAIHLDPAHRWSNAKELGKALAAYMQRNSINDIPITPHIPLDINPADIVVIRKKEALDEASLPVSDKTLVATDNLDAVEADAASPEYSVDHADKIQEYEESIAAIDAEEIHQVNPLPDVTPQETEEASAQQEVVPENLPEDFSEELSEIISKADDLISHEMPEDIVIPQIVPTPDPFDFIDDPEDLDDNDISEETVIADIAEDEPEKPDDKKKKKKEKKFADPKYMRRRKRFVTSLITLLVLSVLGIGAFWYYQNIYLVPINAISITGGQTELTVTIGSERKDVSLLVRCIDAFGKADTHGISDGKTSFSGLQPNTTYTIQVEADGFHKLVGKTSDVFTTDANTTIVNFTSIAGAEDGSVVLNFTANGEEPNNWIIFYSTEGEDEKRKTFTGHSVTIDNLSVGKVYTFRLETGENISLGGQTTLEFMASRLILAENLTVTSTTGNEITVKWNTSGDVVVDNWNVRCYNTAGYDELVTVTEPQVIFTDIDTSMSYVIEVTAAGMTQASRTSITADPLVISTTEFDESAYDKLKMTWEFSGATPEDGWLIIYNLTGGEKNVVKCKEPVAEIVPKLPGAKYKISINSADGTTVFNSNSDFTTAEASSFEKHNLTADKITAKLLKTPTEENWYSENIADTDFSESFTSNDSISIAMFCSDNFYLTGAEVKVLYVLRDSFGNILPELSQEETFYWKDIWSSGDVKNGELTLPATPSAPGSYTLDLYFDGMSAAQLHFTIE